MRATIAATLAYYALGASVVNLTVELESAPLAVDIDWAPPRFGWVAVGAAQATYSIIVATDAALSPSARVWESGIISSAASSEIEYAGAPLVHGAAYFWQVALTFDAGAGGVSAASTFGTGLDSAAWAATAVWLGGCTVGQASPALRRDFALDSAPITRALAYATGLGIYTLHLNGVRVGAPAAVLTPGWSTVPTARVLADAYDVSPLLRAGAANTIGLRLGQAKYGYLGEFCAAGDASCYAGLLSLRIEQGANVTAVVTDTSGAWTCAPSPIVYQHLFNGELYNASLEQPGWDEPGFAPTLPWISAPSRSPNVSLVSPAPPPISVMADVVPVNVTAGSGSQPVIAGGEFVIAADGSSPDVWWWANGTSVRNFVTECTPCTGVDACGALVRVPAAVINGLAKGANFSCAMLPTVNSTVTIFDLGRNMAGFCSLALPSTAPPGTLLSLVHGEILGPDGSVENTFGTSSPTRACSPGQLNCADQLVQFSVGAVPPAAGAVHTPSFTFAGFRYVALFGWPASAPAPTAATLTCHQVHSRMAAAGGITLGDPVLDAVQAMVVQTQRSNFFSIPSDCPTREKRGWMGDAQAAVDQALLNLQAQRLYENWARTFHDLLFMSCTDPDAGAAARSAAATASIDADGPQRPAAYTCCGHLSRFGCQPGVTPDNATGSLPDVAPFDSISGWPGDWLWEVAGIVIPHSLLLRTGNVPTLARLWPYMTELMAFADRAAAATGLLAFGPYGDWLATEGVSTPFAENFYLWRSAGMMAEAAGALGLPSEAAAYTALQAAVGDAMTARLFDSSKGMWDGPSGNQNAQAMALAVGLAGAVTANATATIAAALVADVTAHGSHPTGGLASTRWILQGLMAANASAAALTMATLPDAPSWAYMARPEMPGTVWEEWSGDAHHSDGSKNHPMLSGGIGVWLHESALGLRFSFGVAPVSDAADGSAGAAASTAAIAASGLGADPRVRAGLTHAQAAAAAAAASELRGVAPSATGRLPALRSKLEALHVFDGGRRNAATAARASLIASLTAAPDATIVRALGAASGWAATPQGTAEAEWTWAAPPAAAFRLFLTVPSGTRGRMAVPLSLAIDAARASACDRARLVVSADGPDGELAPALALDAELILGAGGVAAPSDCSSLGTLRGGDAVHLCVRAAGSAAARPSLATAADVEGAGRLSSGEPDAATGALLFSALPPGRFTVTTAPAAC